MATEKRPPIGSRVKVTWGEPFLAGKVLIVMRYTVPSGLVVCRDVEDQFKFWTVNPDALEVIDG